MVSSGSCFRPDVVSSGSSFRLDVVSSGSSKVKEPENPKEMESDSLSEPDENDERITDEKLLEHIGRRGKVLRSVLMSSPKRSPKTFNPGDRYMLKSGHKTFRRNAKFIRRSTVPDESQEVIPLEGSRHSSGRKQPPSEAKN
jgi:hypothetical protein